MEKIIIQAPGRINLIGEHTDYNHGFVLPAAINKKVVFEIKKNNTSSTCNVIAKNLSERFLFDLSDFQPMENGWQNYILGVVAALQKINPNLQGFDCEFFGDVPIGSGMSSSAALECSLAFGLNKLFELGLSQWDLIKACQKAEHDFVGTKCGIMDQFASIMGKKNQAMLLNCQSLKFEYYPLDLGDYQILLLNTNVSHNLANSEYNTRRAECENGLVVFQKYFPEIQSLSNATSHSLQLVQNQMPEIIYRRCKHVISENLRVFEASLALKNKNIKHLGQLIYESHESLKLDYEVSCIELDFLVNFTKKLPYVLGSRMMGGGFGGCTINIIKKDKITAFSDLISAAYQEKFGIQLSPYEVTIEDGAKECINNKL